jgi:nucleoside-diphosphate-sugar epimerase
MFNPMKILVTGATGFLGSCLLPLLVNRGHQVAATVRPGKPTVFPGLNGSTIEQIPVDLSNPFFLDLGHSFDAVITLAQDRDFRKFPIFASNVFNVNASANVRIWEWASRIGVSRVIHASSGGIYGTQKGGAFKEGDLPPVDGQSSYYLETKLCAELAFRAFSSYFDTAVAIRPFFIYGPGQDSDKFVQRMITNVLDGTPIQLTPPDGILTNPIFVNDAAEVFAGSLNLDGYHILNCAGEETVSLRQLCNTIGLLTNRNPNYLVTGNSTGNCIGNTALQKRFISAPKTNLTEGLKLTVKSTLDLLKANE